MASDLVREIFLAGCVHEAGLVPQSKESKWRKCVKRPRPLIISKDEDSDVESTISVDLLATVPESPDDGASVNALLCVGPDADSLAARKSRYCVDTGTPLAPVAQRSRLGPIV